MIAVRMNIDEAVRSIEDEPLPTLPEPERGHSSAEYLSFIAQIIQETNARVWQEKSERAIAPAIRQVAALAVRALEENGSELGLRLVDREWIYGAATPNHAHETVQSLTEYLLDIEGIVLRYKAHRPQMRTPEAAPKVAANLVEIISLALAGLRSHSQSSHLS